MPKRVPFTLQSFPSCRPGRENRKDFELKVRAKVNTMQIIHWIAAERSCGASEVVEMALEHFYKHRDDNTITQEFVVDHERALLIHSLFTHRPESLRPSVQTLREMLHHIIECYAYGKYMRSFSDPLAPMGTLPGEQCGSLKECKKPLTVCVRESTLVEIRRRAALVGEPVSKWVDKFFRLQLVGKTPLDGFAKPAPGGKKEP